DDMLKQDFGGGDRRKALVVASEILFDASGTSAGLPVPVASGPYALQKFIRDFQTRPVPGPLDGVDPKNNLPWIRPDIRGRVDMRLKKPGPQQGAPPGGETPPKQ